MNLDENDFAQLHSKVSTIYRSEQYEIQAKHAQYIVSIIWKFKLSGRFIITFILYRHILTLFIEKSIEWTLKYMAGARPETYLRAIVH